MEIPLDFVVTASLNPFVSREADVLHAIVAVTAQEPTGWAAARPRSADNAGTKTAVAILIDCSKSMDRSGNIESAREATKAAIDALRDGDRFAVIAGREDATMIYPKHVPMLAVATPAERQRAKQLVDELKADGGTAMGQWLRMARAALLTDPAAVRHAILLTDGNNESETDIDLDRALDLCAGDFVADARGIGEGWMPERLNRIASRLRGRADTVSASADLVTEFEAMIRAATAKLLPDLTLEIMTSAPAHLRFIKQVYPLIQDLTEGAQRTSEHAVRTSTGSWQAETRHYHLCVDLRGIGSDLRASGTRVVRIDASVDGQSVTAPTNVTVTWSDNPAEFGRVDPSVVFYTGQSRLSEVVIEGCNAYDAHDLAIAQARFGEAVKLAWTSGNLEQLGRLEHLVHVDDAANGVVRVRPGVPQSVVKWVAVGNQVSAISDIVEAEPPVPDRRPADNGAGQVCSCGYVSPSGSPRCNRCGKAFGPEADG